jgi:nucleoside-diphosphate-sugar epimerase
VTLPKKSLRSAAGTFKSAKSEVERLLGDASKARKLLGWQPKKDFEQGLRLTIEWVQKNLAMYEPSSYQI